jgi:hypothetical protein
MRALKVAFGLLAVVVGAYMVVILYGSKESSSRNTKFN